MALGKSWLEKLRDEEAKRAAPEDPWKLRLERMRGKIDYDGVERVTTQSLFDVLEVPQRRRTAGACRRLAAVMTELGWTAVRVRGLTPGGYREQVRGYCRDARHERRSNISDLNYPNGCSPPGQRGACPSWGGGRHFRRARETVAQSTDERTLTAADTYITASVTIRPLILIPAPWG